MPKKRKSVGKRNSQAVLQRLSRIESTEQKLLQEEKKVEQEAELPKEASPIQNEIEEESIGGKLHKTQLHYNIQIHLPESRDSLVYDVLFRSLKKHLF